MEDVSLNFVNIFKQRGIPFAGAGPLALERFDRHPPELKSSIFHRLNTLYELYNSADLENENLRIDSRMAWRYSRENGLRAPADLFSKIERDWIIEIYSLEGSLCFTGLKYFENVSYTLFDIFTYPWFELFERDEEIQRQMIENMISIASHKTEFVPDWPENEVREIFSENRFRFMQKFKLCSPLFDPQGRTSHFLAACVVKPLSFS